MSEAMQLLGVSRTKIWRMVKAGVLRATIDPLDNRVKLVNRTEVETLLRTRGRAA
ncbi:MAG TPA: helix-turn-helix domain-containing protein [Pyrinomonadaceae bacterium]|nr:helix-turn-helix domain-containing protein [Pyrinomonadaceae bacterium]